MYYFDLLPDELFLFIIEYVDLFNKNIDKSLTIALDGIFPCNQRSTDSYMYYMNLIDNGYINNFKFQNLNNALYLVHERNTKYINIVEDYKKQSSDYDIIIYSENQLRRINELNCKLNGFTITINSIVYLLHYTVEQKFGDNITITLKLIVYFNNNYYYMTHCSFSNGEHGYRRYNIIKYDTWGDCITKIPYSVLKILYDQNNYDKIPEDNGRVEDILIDCKMNF